MHVLIQMDMITTLADILKHTHAIYTTHVLIRMDMMTTLADILYNWGGGHATSYGLRLPVCSQAGAPTGSRLKLTLGSRITLVGSTRLKDQPGSVPLWFIGIGYQICISERICIGCHIYNSKRSGRAMRKLRRQMVC